MPSRPRPRQHRSKSGKKKSRSVKRRSVKRRSARRQQLMPQDVMRGRRLRGGSDLETALRELEGEKESLRKMAPENILLSEKVNLGDIAAVKNLTKRIGDEILRIEDPQGSVVEAAVAAGEQVKIPRSSAAVSSLELTSGQSEIPPVLLDAAKKSGVSMSQIVTAGLVGLGLGVGGTLGAQKYQKSKHHKHEKHGHVAEN